jgi:hypothetical protein
MMTGYLNHVNQLARDNPTNSFQAPHPHLDTISGDMTKFAENTAVVHAFIDRAGTLTAKGENVIRLRTVNTAVQCCSIVRLYHEVQTFFDEAKPVKDENESGMDQDKDQERKLDSQSDEARLLTLSYLEYVGVATAYVLTPDNRKRQPTLYNWGRPC